MSMQSNNPADILNEGLTRAKNMAVAFGMIVFLLLKFFAVKVVYKKLKDRFAWIVVKAAVLLSQAWAKLQPHWEALKLRAAETKVKAVRLTLTALIIALTPIENAAMKVTGVAKERSALIADKSAMTLAQFLTQSFNAIGTAFRTGFTRPGVQKMLNRVFELVDEAQK